MKKGLYVGIAWNNLGKNHRLYVPHILTGMGLTAVFYILLTLSMDNRLREVRGGTYLPTFLGMGVIVITILSIILLLYTNSFLMKQRKREFGLYTVLGMEKRHVGRILFWETVLSAAASILGGLAAGVLLYKLCALLICRILLVDSVLGFYHVSPVTLVPTAVLFAGLYLVTFLYNRIQIALLKPTELLQSSHKGEKEPKIKWLFLVIGLLTLGSGYYIALTTESPLKSLTLFFGATILVIVGTYCLFVAGSIALLKLLKKNKAYYYNKKHFVSISGLLYRMKQNAVGLASIAVLATGVLIMVSTSVSLYAGIEDQLEKQYPHQLYVAATYSTKDGEMKTIPGDTLCTFFQDAAEDYGLSIAFAEEQKFLQVSYLYKDGDFIVDRGDQVLENIYDDLIEVFYVTAEQYEVLTGEHLDLGKNELALYTQDSTAKVLSDTLSLAEQSFTVTQKLESFPVSMYAWSLVDCYGIVVSDEDVLQLINENQQAYYGGDASVIMDSFAIDFAEDNKAVGAVFSELMGAVRTSVSTYVEQQPDVDDASYGVMCDARWDTEEYMYGMTGTLLFLGLILALVFLFATALIIYYKQISEGYEDRERFQIMQKVGMSAAEVKGTIRNQIILVFFLPLLVAGIHMAVAFPILVKLLRIFFLSSAGLFLGCTVIAFVVFAVIYILIYSMTARVYYHIVH